MQSTPYVYIAGPYSQPDQAVNVRLAIEAADKVLELEAIPFIPHLTHFWHMLVPRTYETWLAYDLFWLKKCDVVVRLPGKSPGADAEVKEAIRLGIPVMCGVGELRRWLRERTE